MHFAMFYEYSADYLERRTQFRAEHLRLAWEASARGELFLGGAFAEPPDGALLIFHCDSMDVP